MDLVLYPTDTASDALYKIAIDESEDETILDSCGESLANIWISRNKIDAEKVKKLSQTAFYSAKQYIKGYKPEWLIYFE